MWSEGLVGGGTLNNHIYSFQFDSALVAARLAGRQVISRLFDGCG